MFDVQPKIVTPNLSMVFNADKWNEPSVVESANCMAYALDRQDLGWVFPSLDSVSPISLPSGSDNIRNILKNIRTLSGSKKAHEAFMLFAGLKKVRPHSVSPDDHHIIAFDGDHFYRRDSDGTWSHKNGSDPATNRHANGEVILNLERGNKREKNSLGQYKEDAETLSLIREYRNIDPRSEGYIPEARALFNYVRSRIGEIHRTSELSYFVLPNSGFYLFPRNVGKREQVQPVPIAA